MQGIAFNIISWMVLNNLKISYMLGVFIELVSVVKSE
jgi:hypothetical protein